MSVWSGQIFESKRLSFNRSQHEAALRSTTPRLKTKSSTSDFAPLHSMGWISSSAPELKSGSGKAALLWLSHRRRRNRSTRVYHCLPMQGHRAYRYIFGRDSDLEAFSHNPSDGSLAPLAYQPSTWTKCLNLRFLSYWAGLPLQQPVISRVKLTCLTTV